MPICPKRARCVALGPSCGSPSPFHVTVMLKTLLAASILGGPVRPSQGRSYPADGPFEAVFRAVGPTLHRVIGSGAYCSRKTMPATGTPAKSPGSAHCSTSPDSPYRIGP